MSRHTSTLTFISLSRLSRIPMAFSISPGEPWKLPMPNGSAAAGGGGRAAGAGGGGAAGEGGENGSAPNRSLSGD